MREKKVHVGDQFGDLVVEKIYMGNATRCVCRCKCGNTIDLFTSALLRRKNPTCGCESRKPTPHKIPDRIQAMKGNTYGTLEVLDVFRPSHANRSGKYTTKLRCRCLNCGTVTEPNASAVLCGQIKSCSTCNRKVQEMAKDARAAAYIGGTNVTMIDGRKRMNKNNTTGYNGVSKRGDRYLAYIYFKRKQYYLGLFDTPEAAAEARMEAEERIYGDFIQWYKNAYPDYWGKLRMRDIKDGKE